ncbi:hypothetical protein [Caballeronia sordidicola]|nr:hypothetical protein [Caballeronia sordidicola]
MSLIRNRHARCLMLAAAAGVVAASTMYAPVASAGGVGSNDAAVTRGVFSHGVETPGPWQAVNQRALRVEDADNGAQPFGYQRVAAGSGLTPISAEVRGGPRAEQGAQLRGGGSIRADIARYNEERSTPRASGHQSDDSRSPANSTYRN